MTYSTGMRSAVCFAALLASGAAHADVTAAQVWEDWKSQIMLYGDENVSIAAEDTSSGTVTVRGLTMRFADEDVAIEAAIGDLLFNEQSDGSVRVTMDDSFPISMTVEDGTVINIIASSTNLETIASGEPDAIDYDITADQYRIAFLDAVNGGVTIDGDASMTLSDIAANYETSVGDMRETSYSASIGLLDLLVDFQIPGGQGEYVTAAAKYTGMTTQGDMTMPLDADLGDPDAPFPDGMAFAGGYVVDATDFVVDVNAEGDQFAASGSVGTTTLTGSVSGQAVSYDAAANDLSINMQTSEFPLPIEVSMDRYVAGIDVPTGESDTAQPIGLRVGLVNLVVSDGIWDLFDPGRVLPRDPATFELSIAGSAKALFNMMSPDGQMAMAQSGGLPYELESVELDTLNIAVAGASVSGGGSFTFDNSDMQTFAPLPKPEGDATVQINGLNKLLDNLVAMGLVPAEDVMAPRMMMGMFARSVGDDQMEIGVEVNKAGEVLVNGNRVR